MTIVTHSPPQTQHKRRQSSLLGTTTSIASGPQKAPYSATESKDDLQSIRYRLQDTAAWLLPNERVSRCMRGFAPVNPEAGKQAYTYNTVEIHHIPSAGRAWYKNLLLCGSIWTCPVCAARISENRRALLAHVLERSGAYPLLITVTLRHHKKNELGERLKVLSAAYRRFTAGRWYQEIKAQYGLKGAVSGLEVTHTVENGWHPHKHVLMLFSARLKPIQVHTLEHALKMRWLACLAKEGGSADYAHGLTVSYGKDVAGYVAKFGRQDIESKGWGLDREVTKSNVKIQATESKGRTPFQILSDAAHGDRLACALFRDYAAATKGRNQLTWSSGWLSDLRAQVEQEIAENEQEICSQSQMLAEISKDDWHLVIFHRKRGELLQLAATHGAAGLLYDFINDLSPPTLPRNPRFRSRWDRWRHLQLE